MVVKSEVFGYENFYISIVNSVIVSHNIVNGVVVHMVAQYLFGADLVTICYGYVVHLVAETDDEHILCVGPCGSYTHP